LSGARGIFPPLRPPQTLVEINPELNSEVVTGAVEALWDMGSDLWNTVTNPIGSVVDALEGVQELIDDPIGTAQEVWEDFTEPYVEDWENGREGEAIGRGLVELGANFIPGYNVLRWLNRFDDANSDDRPEAPPSESGSSGDNELPEGDQPSSDSDGPIDDPPGGNPPAAGSDESDDESDDGEPEDTPSDNAFDRYDDYARRYGYGDDYEDPRENNYGNMGRNQRENRQFDAARRKAESLTGEEYDRDESQDRHHRDPHDDGKYRSYKDLVDDFVDDFDE
jgi:hypothetical protein